MSKEDKCQMLSIPQDETEITSEVEEVVHASPEYLPAEDPKLHGEIIAKTIKEFLELSPEHRNKIGRIKISMVPVITYRIDVELVP